MSPSPTRITTAESDCPFCERIERYDYEQGYGGSVVRFAPLNPVVPGHMLFVPERHVEHEAGCSDDVGVAMRYAERYGIERGEDFNLITSSGRSATQTVAHIHVHYVPRRAGDLLSLPWSEHPAAPPVSDTAAESGAPTRVECLAAASALDGVVLMLDCDDCPGDLARLADQWRDQASKTPEPPDTAATTITREVVATALAEHVIGEPTGGTASGSRWTCSCDATRLIYSTRDYAAWLGLRHQADAVLAALGLTVTDKADQ